MRGLFKYQLVVNHKYPNLLELKLHESVRDINTVSATAVVQQGGGDLTHRTSRRSSATGDGRFSGVNCKEVLKIADLFRLTLEFHGLLKVEELQAGHYYDIRYSQNMPDVPTEVLIYRQQDDQLLEVRSRHQFSGEIKKMKFENLLEAVAC